MDDIILFLSRTTEAETMLKEMNKVEKRFRLQINWRKIHFMKNAYSEGEGMQLKGLSVEELPPYVYFGRSTNMHNNLDDALNRRSRAARLLSGH